MKKLSLLKTILVVAIGSTLLTGCVVRERTVYRQPPPPPPVGAEIVVDQPPPPPVVETVTVSPGPAYVWIGGAWAWHGRWVWERGHWAHPPHPGAFWVAHHYERRNGVYIFVRGGWRY
jgi:hypothetical protein